jgi:hypothetical protein
MQFYYGHIVAYEERGKAHKFTLQTIHSDPARSQKVQFTLFDRDVAFQANQAATAGTPVVAVCHVRSREYQGKIYTELNAECLALNLKDLHKTPAKPAEAAVFAEIKPKYVQPKWETNDDDDIPF